MTSCSVVMVSYYTGPALFASVKSVLKQSSLAELVLVNNGNPPDVLARLQQMSLTDSRLVIVSGQGNIGFARGCNMGAARATAEFVALLHPDCLLPPEAISTMMAAFADRPDAVLAGGWLQNPDGSEQRGGRRNILTPMTALSETFGLYRLSPEKFPRLYLHDIPMPGETHEVEALSGAFFVLRKNDYVRQGGLDEGFFLYGADLDLCMRIRASGGKIICVPRVRITRMLRASGGTSVYLREWNETQSLIRYFHKHGQWMLLLLLLDAGLWVRFTLRLGFGTAQRYFYPEQKSYSVAAKRLMVLASGLVDLPQSRDWAEKTVLVTDGMSQVGLSVMRRMLAAGATVIAVSSQTPIPFRHEKLFWLKSDLDAKTFDLGQYPVDIAVHTAPLWQLPPILGALAKAQVKRIIAFGSTSVFSKVLSRNAYEKDVVSKLAKAEAGIISQCAEKNLQWTILRPTTIYGLGLDVSIHSLARIIRWLGFFPVYPPASGRRQPVHADDLAIAVMQAAHAPASVGKAYNLSGGEVISYRDMLMRLFAICGKKPYIPATTLLPFLLDMAGWVSGKKHINGEMARRMNDDLVFFHDEAANDFDFAPRPFLSGGLRDIEGF